jgi:hypothetical protein
VALMSPALAQGRSRRLAGTPVPPGFVGMNVDGPVLTPQGGVALPDQFGSMRSSGVQSVRAVFSWAAGQPYASWSDVPPAQHAAFLTGPSGIPTTYAGTDQIVELAAASGMSVLPIVMYTPSWDAAPAPGTDLPLPRDNRLYADYVTTLIERYGPRGTFWGQHPTVPRRPIRAWEIWDEPDLPHFWDAPPWESKYVALLGPAHAAVKRADPGARVVLAGLTAYSWLDLAALYEIRGARRLFDVVEVHPYTKYPAGVVQILANVRATMDKAGDHRKPIIAGETGWMSSLHQTRQLWDYETTEAGQASRLRSLLRLLASNRRRLNLIGFDWYTWMGREFAGASPFSFSGLRALRNGQVTAKPAVSVFNQTAHAIER